MNRVSLLRGAGLLVLLLSGAGCESLLKRGDRGGDPAMLQDVVLPAPASYQENSAAVTADAQRVFELQGQVEDLRTGNRGLRVQLADAQDEIELRDAEIERQQRLLRDAQRALEQADGEVLQARQAVEQWRGDMLALQQRLDRSEKEHLASMDELSGIITLLLAKEANESSW
jgi:chromosome segregation ATPase